jgi:hypothetical protein
MEDSLNEVAGSVELATMARSSSEKSAGLAIGARSAKLRPSMTRFRRFSHALVSFQPVWLAQPFAAMPSANAAGEDYAVLIISRERLEVPTNCEIGVYINDQLSARLFQEQSTSFNLPPGNVSLRLKLLPGQAPGCNPGMLAPPAQNITLKAGDVLKYRIAAKAKGCTCDLPPSNTESTT